MISVIMLTYNRENLVGKAVESILNQTLNAFEFIIIDNGSTDSSGAICEQYAKKDLRIQVIHLKKGNIGRGRNVGLDRAIGEYVMFIDDDDYAEPDCLEFLYHLVVSNDAEVAICGTSDKAYDEKLLMNPEEALIELMWRKRYNVAFPAKLFRRSLFENLRFPLSGKFDDIALMYKLLARAKRIAYHGVPKYTFVRHETNNSAWTTNHKLLTPETLDEYIRVYRERTEWLSETFPRSEDIFCYFEWSFLISMVDKITRYELKDCNAQLEVMIGKLKKDRNRFLSSGSILDFEKEWMEKYI